MKVQEVLINNRKRYLLIDGDNKPVVPVLRFLKYLDNIGKAENTLKSYCHYLKFYFQFLNEKEKEYKDVDLDLLAVYLASKKCMKWHLKMKPLVNNVILLFR